MATDPTDLCILGEHNVYSRRHGWKLKRRWIEDSGFLDYEEADHFRMELERRHPECDFFVADSSKVDKQMTTK